MSEPKLTVTISGEAGAGKSSLAHWLAERLQHTFAIGTSVEDDDPSKLQSFNLVALDVLAQKGLHVEIKTVMTTNRHSFSGCGCGAPSGGTCLKTGREGAP
jgi:nucleoside-triphosphatase THEP1